ncbi:MAG: SDR family oxidoreductase [Acidimicrobiales bacterium]
MDRHKLTALSRSVAGHTVVVTGAASGMGRATAMLFSRGAKVAITDLKGEAGRGRRRRNGGRWRHRCRVTMDVSSGADIAATIPAIGEEFGRIDVVVNNAGVSVLLGHRCARLRGAMDDQPAGVADGPHPGHTGCTLYLA